MRQNAGKSAMLKLPDGTPLLSTAEAADIIGMHPDSFPRSARDTYHVEPAAKIGNAYAWRQDDVEEIARQFQAKSSPQTNLRTKYDFVRTERSGKNLEMARRRRDLRKAMIKIGLKRSVK